MIFCRAALIALGGGILLSATSADAQMNSRRVDVDFVITRDGVQTETVTSLSQTLQSMSQLDDIYFWSTPDRVNTSSKQEVQIVYSDAVLRSDVLRVRDALAGLVTNRVCVIYAPDGHAEGLGDINVHLPQRVDQVVLLGGRGPGAGMQNCLEPNQAVS
ncbi:hypothetical protein [Ponticaulis sp.]|uniref:hypothetical protein n=1 Tax=Ponticaulis sp. TaxID=2020902 RepID=UPI000C6AAE9B|nr:hypothetical protein [Ponticaulis sp.]MBN02854.1 hypothetical protein [Ponticaulis sp.]|tara:strand:+ start:504 stop:980 length:477 start_codon:yes stop_codon:yes gene_type:complete